MSGVILRTGARILRPVLLLFSLFLLLRGHDAPGGGFAGGLVAAASLSLYAMAFGVPATRRALRVEPHGVIGIGLLVMLASGAPGALTGGEFLTGRWVEVSLPVLGTLKAGTPLLFDVGVYLAVLGMALLVILTLMEDAT